MHLSQLFHKCLVLRPNAILCKYNDIYVIKKRWKSIKTFAKTILVVMFPAEIFQLIFRCCDIDTKLALRKVYPDFAYRNDKVISYIHLEPLTVYNPHYAGRVPLNIPFIDNPWDNDTWLPWVMGSDDNKWWELIWGRYRVLRSNCQKCGGAFEYSTFTCNQTDFADSRYLVSTRRSNLAPSHASNWLGSLCSSCLKSQPS